MGRGKPKQYTFPRRHYKETPECRIQILFYAIFNSIRKTAELWSISEGTVRRIIDCASRGDTLDNKGRRGPLLRLQGEDLTRFYEIVDENAKDTDDHILRIYNESVASNVQLKKDKRVASILRPVLTEEHKRKRREFVFEVLSYHPDRLVFLDEKNYYTGASPKSRKVLYREEMDEETRRKVLLEVHSATYWKKMYLDVVCAGLLQPKVYHRVVKGVMNGDSFHKELIKIHRVLKDEHDVDLVLVLDGAPSHKTEKCMRYARSKFAHVLKQPPYSPELNALDASIYSRCQRFYAALRPRGVDEIEDRVRETWEQITPEMIRESVRHTRHNAVRIALAWGEPIVSEHTKIPREIEEAVDRNAPVEELKRLVNEELRRRGLEDRQYT